MTLEELFSKVIGTKVSIEYMEREIPRGIRNNNPLNIKRNKIVWQGQRATQSDKTFVQFETAAMGYRAAFMILYNYINGHGWVSIDSIIKHWAPSSENNTERYINTVVRLSKIDRHKFLMFEQVVLMCDLVRAMAIVENGYGWVDEEDLQKGYELAYNSIKHIRK